MARKVSTTEQDNRWFRVTADRFDWVVRPNMIVSFTKGAIDFRPKACIEAGLSLNAIEVISKPAGYRVDKSGKVVKE